MALQKNIETSNGLSADSAYMRVENITLIAKNIARFSLKSYINHDSSEPIKTEVFAFDYDLDGENPIKQAYSYLKTLPEFSEATDV
jgi:hypothetical protein